MATNEAKVLAKGLLVLDKLTESPDGMKASELASLLEVHKTSIYRYLNVLSRYGYIYVDTTARYHLGNKVLELGSERLRRIPLRDTAHPFLVELSAKTHTTVHLCILDGLEVVYLDKVESLRSLPILSRIGSRAPAYCTGIGKALLSGIPTDLLVSLLQGAPLEKRTPTTITDPMKLLEDLRLSAKRGYAIDNSEHEEGIMCFAKQINGFAGKTEGAISVTGLRREFDNRAEAQRILGALQETAYAISTAMGYVETA